MPGLYRVRNEEGRRRAGMEMKLKCRADQRVLRWLGHAERIDEYLTLLLLTVLLLIDGVFSD